MRSTYLVLSILYLLLMACTPQKEDADLILHNGTIYTVAEQFSTAEAVAVKDGRILATGSSQEVLKRFHGEEQVDLDGKFLYPGWIDAHCHFAGYGLSLNEVDLAGTTSVEEIIGRIKAHRESHEGPWITGRGWDQNDWEVKEFPSKEMLDAHFPETPVLLRRVDGHAAWANSKALNVAGVTASSRMEGGEVLLSKGRPTGILIDNAIELVGQKVPPPGLLERKAALLAAQENCFAVGLTSVQDAGLSREVVELIAQAHQSGELHMRINAWLSPTEENFSHFVEKGPYQDEHLSVNTIKLFTDGALGSRGALMSEAYSDDPHNHGLLLTSLEDLEGYSRRAYAHDFAVATHCIGDSANRLTLELYARILGGQNDRRWRIEHSQIIHPDDFHYFGEYSIVPSVQSTHATSDMYWAEDRLGPERMKGAYAYKSLLEQNGWLPNGSDFPVEHINPLYGFYAAVVRKDHQGYPEAAFLKEDALSREEALRAMTIWAARAGREEQLKGSIEAGKLADFTITPVDLMSAPENQLFAIPVQATMVGGALVYGEL